MQMRLNNVRGGDWTLTNEHAASSYGNPVLVAADGTAYGPRDWVGDITAQTIVYNWLLWARDIIAPEEYDFVLSFKT